MSLYTCENLKGVFMLKKIILFILFIMFIYIPTKAQTPEQITVGLRSFDYRPSFNIRNTSIIADNNIFNSPSGFIINASGLYSDSTRLQNTPTRISSMNNEFILLENNQYRGMIEFNNLGNNLFPINIISLDDYLFGVVPREMSPSFHIEALKAQAVAARTFTLYTRDMQKHIGFDICDLSECCQMYRGADREHENTTHAVIATSGLVMLYDNEPILAAYFSSSGGSTDSSANVWGGVRSYLQGVFDIYETNPRIWTRDFTWDELTTIANNIGIATGLSITERGQTGRVTEIIIHGTYGNHIIRGENIRSLFNLDSRNFTIDGVTEINNSFFITNGTTTIEKRLEDIYVLGRDGLPVRVTELYIYDGRTVKSNNIKAAGGIGVTLNGRGWGHGVGMSQWGANGMAQAGYNFWEILKFYYTGIEIRG